MKDQPGKITAYHKSTCKNSNYYQDNVSFFEFKNNIYQPINAQYD